MLRPLMPESCPVASEGAVLEGGPQDEGPNQYDTVGVLNGTTGGDGAALLLLYEALGGFLAYLFQRSGGSLPLVVVTHCSFNLAVALLVTQVDPVAVLL